MHHCLQQQGQDGKKSKVECNDLKAGVIFGDDEAAFGSYALPPKLERLRRFGQGILNGCAAARTARAVTCPRCSWSTAIYVAGI